MARRNELGELRRSAVVTTFGPGAIVDFRAGDAPISVVAGGLEAWDQRSPPAGIRNEQSVFEARLQKQLNVAGFRLPPVYPGDNDDERRSLVGVRFPTWLQCPQCHILKPQNKWGKDPAKAGRKCGACTSREGGERPVYAVPVRFVVACESGHIDDFPWHFWVGHKEDCKRRGNLKLKSEGAGLSGLILRCLDCKASRSMEGVFSKQTLSGLSCRGLRPWLPAAESDSCDHTPRVLQRGASNLYFPVIRSALDIPPWSDTIQRLLGQFWYPITQIPDPDDREKWVLGLYPALGLTDMTPDQLVRQVEDRLRILEQGDSDNLRWDEYSQFVSGKATLPEEDAEFEIRPARMPDSLRPYFDHLVRAFRLREVRAISGFTRIYPPANAEDEQAADVAPIQLNRHNWLPAIEVRGEGIFIALKEDRLADWEGREEVARRAADLNERHTAAWKDRYGTDGEPELEVTARLLLVHTLAHILIKELALECGYSSTALRERLYVGERPTQMSGLLIYTASSDSDGTLGGLVREGRPERIEALLHKAVEGARWCSSDPLCIGGLTAASEAMNNAACHSCVLASETSCEQYNRFLDRRLLIDPAYGFFRDLNSTPGAVRAD